MSTRVMVVDDDQDIRTIVEAVFLQQQYVVKTCASGEEALEEVEEFQPDLIILDVMMPGLDGYQVSKQLKKDFETAHIPIILLTARQELSDLERGVESSIDDYIAKPFNHRELMARSKMVLARSRYQMGCNPLTGLPGNLEIEYRAKEMLRLDEENVIFYLDIDGFKAYNDYYGYAQGDKVIKLLSHVLITVVRKHSSPDDFIGHVGGDDFIVMTKDKSSTPLAEQFIEQFEEKIKDLFTKDVLEQGYYEIRDRTGRLRRYPPLLTLTIVIVNISKRHFDSYAELSGALMELKKFGKQKPGSTVVYERRHDEPE
ncbi:response regulator [bacterium]|nr:response regulator [bacterium]